MKRGITGEVVRDYEENQLRHFNESSYIVERSSEDVKDKSFYFSCVEMLNEKGEYTNLFRYNEKLVLIVQLSGEPLNKRYGVNYYIHSQWGQRVSTGSSGIYQGIYFDSNIRKIRIEIGPLVLASGQYAIWLRGYYGEGAIELLFDDWGNACSFTVETQPFRPGRDITLAEGVCVMPQSFQAIE